MRTITESEAKVVASLLADQALTEREKADRLGLPLRTYQGISRRMHLNELVGERYVPDLGLFEAPYVSIFLAKPFAEEEKEFREVWSHDRSIVHLWSSPGALLGVLAHASPEEGSLWSDRCKGLREKGRLASITTDTRVSGIPVYFDFEGVWAHLFCQSRSQDYPRPLCSQSGRPPGDLSKLRSTLADLTRRPLIDPGSSTDSIRRSFLPRPQRQLMERGLARHRLFLDPTQIPPLKGYSIVSLVFVSGQLLPGESSVELFLALRDLCQVSPFLFATDKEKVLMGTLAIREDSEIEAVAADVKSPVIRVLSHFMNEVEVVRMPLDRLRVLIDHRYDRIAKWDPEMRSVT